jgi:hypothetical protein
VALAASLLFITSADAGAPQLKTQAPGYYRMMLGDVQVTVLSDGMFPMDASKILTNITPKQLDADLGRSFLKEPAEQGAHGCSAQGCER